MPISFTCPHCGVQTDVADRYAGRRGPCARCGQTIEVPTTTAPREGEPRGCTGVLGVAAVALAVLVLLLVGGGVLVVVLRPVARLVPAPSGQTQCSANLQQIAQAMFQYRYRWGTLPPAYVAGADGKPMHSWRVLLLPYLGYETIYDQYNFEQPWDGPDNLALISFMPEVFRCPDDSGAAPFTSYVMIVGPEMVSTGPEVTDLNQMTDGPANTLLVVETTNSGIHWAEPRDLNAEEITFGINDPGSGGIRSNHPGGVSVIRGDGSTSFLSEGISAEDVRAMATAAGGEVVLPQ